MTDVLLINANQKSIFTSSPSIPVGIAQLASYLEKNEICVKILDMDIENNIQKSLELALKDNPKVIGISASSLSIPNAVIIAKSIKKYTESPIIIGGYHVNGDPNFIKEFKEFFDYEIVGEGEITLTMLIKKILSGNLPKDKIFLGKPLKNIKVLPSPSYHLLKMEEYKKYNIRIMSSILCPFKCIFCSIGPSKAKFKNPKKIVEELEFLKNKYNIERVVFEDPNFTLNKNHTINLCKNIIKKKIDVAWSATTRCDLVDRNIIKLMEKAGCKVIRFGVESFSNKILQKIKKNIKVYEITKAIKLTRECNIKVGINLLMGFPQEERRDLKNNLLMIRATKPDFVSVSFLMPFPGTELFNIAIKNGLDKKIWYKYARGEIQTPPIILSRKINRFWYFYYFNKILLDSFSKSWFYDYKNYLTWSLSNGTKLLFPRLSELILKNINKNYSMKRFINKFSRKINFLN